MRRIILAATTGALLLSGSACGTKSDTDAAAAPPATAVTVSASPSADYTADTKKVCGEIDKLLDGKQMEKFGEELGKLIVYKQAKATAEAKKARTAAGERLTELGKAMNEATAAAQDPELKAAGEEALQAMTRTAEDDAFFAKLKTAKDLDKTLESGITAWLTPLASYCA